MPRGRPKRVSIDPVVSDLAPPSAQAPRRGRSGGTTKAAVGTEDTPAKSVDEAPRRRGRPRKHPIQPKAETKPESEPESEHEAEAEPKSEDEAEPESEGDKAAPEPPRRGRGRPRKSDSATAGPIIAPSPTEAPAAPTKTGRPRGRPPKVVKQVPAKKASAYIPTGRPRGRPPKSAGKQVKAPTPPVSTPPAVDSEEHEVSEPENKTFALENCVGSYTIECQTIRAITSDTDNYTLDICLANDGENMLAGSFKLGEMSGIMRLSLSKPRLEAFIREQERLEKADLLGESSKQHTSKAENSSEGSSEESGSDADVEDNDGDTESQAATGDKRKAIIDPEPVKRGRGHPPKKAKVVRAPTPPRPIRLYFVYRAKIENEQGVEIHNSQFGIIKPDDTTCSTFAGVFESIPVADGKNIQFSGRKDSDDPGDDGPEPWKNFW